MIEEINGITNEYEFVRYLNNNKVCKLNPIFEELINNLYNNPNEKLLIKC